MKKSFYIYSLLLLNILISLTSCKKGWFDVKSSKSMVVPSTLQDFQFVLDNYNTMNINTPFLAELGSDLRIIQESQWENLIGSKDVRNAYTWSNAPQYDIAGDWNGCYKRIFYCNLVLDGLTKISVEKDQQTYNIIKGNALFHRAKNYYDLAQVYAQPFVKETSVTDLGLPLKEGIDVTEYAVRASVNNTYGQIISDLKQAAELLADRPEIVTRGSKAASYALLARTYLMMHEYEQARYYADRCLGIQNDLIDFNGITSPSLELGKFENKEIIFFASAIAGSLPNSSFTVNPTLYDLYEANDQRRLVCFQINNDKIYFRAAYGPTNSIFNGLATDEQYLIRAECYARTGNIDAAMDDINTLLRKRYLTNSYIDQTAASEEGALKRILLERKKELLFRNLHWQDLRRLNLDDRFKATLTKTIGGNTYILEPGSYKYTLPIPQGVMMLAPKMKQNPGWQ